MSEPSRLAMLGAGHVGPVIARFGAVLTRPEFERAVHQDVRSLT